GGTQQAAVAVLVQRQAHEIVAERLVGPRVELCRDAALADERELVEIRSTRKYRAQRRRRRRRDVHRRAPEIRAAVHADVAVRPRLLGEPLNEVAAVERLGAILEA